MTTEPRSESQVTLKIPRPLYVQLKQVIQGSGFHSVTEFVVYVLRDLASNHVPAGAVPTRAPTSPSPDEEEEVEPLSPAEIDAVRRRLESLGYL
ncbi:MAG TPA: CopG family transcriptional regulator [Actinomycetota bacterium]|jgi:hypothetical protein|nr:CopG family transcriptional regulator [Actinomycetota bacterium]